ncbi:MAG: calcium/sodium antiporter [Deltaproteobacteria bacterium]|nr:calcium/sodium antiporter [Deltaproteobacteria bacterium]
MTLSILFCMVGFLMLYYGAGWLVKGSSGLAKSLGITPLVIGLTVVAFGTSAPELVVSLISSLKGKSMIAVGNVVGSNICNIALVLGLSALFQPITSQRGVVQRDIPIMLFVSFILLFFSLDSKIDSLEGAVLFAGIILYTIFNYRIGIRMQLRKLTNDGAGTAEIVIKDTAYVASRKKQIVLIVLGITGVILGAQAVVDSATKIMQYLGVNEKFIGLTIVAFGTSLPELATSIVAAIRKEMDISIGNLVGSNVFNILSVIGVTALVKPIYLPGGFIESGLLIDYLVMIFISFLPWLMMWKTFTVSRSGGSVLLACYIGYFIYLLKTL